MHWSDELSQAMLSSIPDDRIEQLLRDCQSATAAKCGRVELLKRCRTDSSLRLAMMGAWRSFHADVIAAAQLAGIDGSPEQSQAMASQFGAEEILLELLTDEEDDGWALAEWTVGNVRDVRVQRELSQLLMCWRGNSDTVELATAHRPSIRIVIFGGHQRDESKMKRRLFTSGAFDVRWKPCEKNQGSPDEKGLKASMAHVDAVLLVTTMVSHNILRIVKRFTKEKGIPLKLISKATDQPLRAALSELFPAVALPGG